MHCRSPLPQIADIWSCGVMLYVMLVGAYPFERPEDKHDNQKLQKMIQVGHEITCVYVSLPWCIDPNTPPPFFLSPPLPPLHTVSQAQPLMNHLIAPN